VPQTFGLNRQRERKDGSMAKMKSSEAVVVLVSEAHSDGLVAKALPGE